MARVVDAAATTRPPNEATGDDATSLATQRTPNNRTIVRALRSVEHSFHAPLNKSGTLGTRAFLMHSLYKPVIMYSGRESLRFGWSSNSSEQQV